MGLVVNPLNGLMCSTSPIANIFSTCDSIIPYWYPILAEKACCSVLLKYNFATTMLNIFLGIHLVYMPLFASNLQSPNTKHMDFLNCRPWLELSHLTSWNRIYHFHIYCKFGQFISLYARINSRNRKINFIRTLFVFRYKPCNWTLAGGKIRAGEVENCARAEKRAAWKTS